MIQAIQEQTKASARRVCEAAGLGYRRLLRWRARASAGAPVLASPGPKKITVLPLAALEAEIASLHHGRKRTHGTGALYLRHRDVISRRALGRLVAAERTRQRGVRRQLGQHIQWHLPNLAWAIDASERERDASGHKLHIHSVRDLCSRYGFEPYAATESNGMEVAAHLQRLFKRYGAPLFLKRDNGAPFNDHAVDAVLARFGVIPLNSPCRYPQYNGAMERGIGQLQAALGGCLPTPPRWDPSGVAPYILAVQHELNWRPRRSLRGCSAAQAYHQQPRGRYSWRARLAAFEWIKVHAIDRIHHSGKRDRRSVRAAWRAAAESWLRCQGLITVSLNRKVSPHFPRTHAHN